MELEKEWLCEECGTELNGHSCYIADFGDFWMCWSSGCEKYISEDIAYEDDN